MFRWAMYIKHWFVHKIIIPVVSDAFVGDAEPMDVQIQQKGKYHSSEWEREG